MSRGTGSSMLSVGDVARVLSVHTNTVRRWSDLKMLKTYRVGPRGDRRFRDVDLNRFLVEQSETTERANVELGAMLKVKDVMTTDIISVEPSAPVIEVAQQMLAFGRGVIPVCSKSEFRGLVRERDLVGLIASTRDSGTEPANSVMSNNTPLISPDADVMEGVKVMVNSRASVLPVVQDGKLLGLLTLDDLIRESLSLRTVLAAVGSLGRSSPSRLGTLNQTMRRKRRPPET